MIFNLITKAKDLFFNNKVSGLSATNVEDAINEVNDSLKDTHDGLSNYLPLAGGTLKGGLLAQTISPSTPLGYGLGTSGYPWAVVNSKSFYARNSDGGTYGQLNVAVNGTTSTDGLGLMVVGNNIPSGTDKNASGCIRMHGKSSAYTQLVTNNNTATNNTLTLPPSTGTVALTSDLSNYLPLSGGTVSGQIIGKRFNSNPTESIAPSTTAFSGAQFVANANYNTDTTKRAGYGFHNAGLSGTFFYLDTDGHYKSIDNKGTTKKIVDSSCFSYSNGTLNITI